MNPLDEINQRRAAELDDYVYDITNRPDNIVLRLLVTLQGVFCAAVGGGVLFVVGACAGVRSGFALMGLIGLGGVAALWWSLAALRRVGRKARAEYVRHGGNPAGTSDLLFGTVVYRVMPDGRWKWPEPSTGGD